jgi:hypothetical protein
MGASSYTIAQFDADLAAPYAWPGGYPRFFITSDGEALSFAAAAANADIIRQAIADGDSGGWRPVACGINWEDSNLYCAHSNAPIESAYGESE